MTIEEFNDTQKRFTDELGDEGYMEDSFEDYIELQKYDWLNDMNPKQRKISWMDAWDWLDLQYECFLKDFGKELPY